MTKKFLAQAALWGAALMTAYPVIAGLSLSDAPMFVTEVLTPNVILSPAYRWNSNEVSLMDLPWDTYVACGTGMGVGVKRELCPKTNSPASFPNDPDPGFVLATGGTAAISNAEWAVGSPFKEAPWRVTPWPGVVGCESADEYGYSCSDKQVYPDASVYMFDGLDVKDAYEEPYGEWYKAISNMDHPNYEPYDKLVHRYEKGKARYARSNKNFLYFRPGFAALYTPWPSLGGVGVFSDYSSTAADTPLYNPLNPDATIKATLGVGQTYRFAEANRSGTVDDAFLGKYYTYNGGDVWKSSSYSESSLAAADKIAFAHWFTYWRSSYLASRGMLGKVLSELQSRQLINRFRIGLNYKDAAGTRHIAIKAFTSANADTNLAELANIIYNYNTDFTGWDHYSTLKYFKNAGAYKETPDSLEIPVSSDIPDNPSGWGGVRSCRRNYEIVLAPDYSLLRHSITLPSAVGTYDPNTGSDTRVPNTWESSVRPSSSDEELLCTATGVPCSAMESHSTDGLRNLWGDVGAMGWNQDLTPLGNTLLKGKQDDATWQHLVRYVIAPKAEGFVFKTTVEPLFNPATASYDDALSRLKANPASGWVNPTPANKSGQGSVDDIWHMALNSRGMFYPSDSIQNAIDNLIDSFNDILVRNVTGSAVATNTSSLSQGGKIYQATVESDWKGHLRAYNVITGTILQIDYRGELWDLAVNVSAQEWDAREIATFNGTTGVRFLWDNIGTPAQDRLKAAVPAGITGDVNQNAYGGKLLEYLRGSGDCEDGHSAATNADCTSGVSYTFRRRNIDRSNTAAYSESESNGRNVLGDIANSNPWLVSPPPAGRSDVDFPNYNAFRVTNKTRTKVLYVGANDGMLHAVDASDGAELFAYIPSFVQANLYQLASSSYSHKFFVDGSPFSADVDLSGWKTVLAGGANKGGKGYYLLDVTNPTANTELTAGGANGWVRWEFTHPRDLHYTFNLPIADSHGQARQIVKMNDDKLALIVGNGYPEEASKRACLFILYLSGPGADAGDAAGDDYHGTGYHKLCAGAATYATDGGLDTNGLSTPFPVDLTGDGKVDVVYAGDLNGNMWKFDVSAVAPTTTTTTTTTTIVDGVDVQVTTTATTNNWAVAYSGSPLFVAKSAASPAKRQPIITPPELILHSEGTTSGPLVLFGTGKYIDGGADGVGGDRANTDVQSFYGVWDRLGLSGITRANLFEQTFQLDTSLTQPIRKQPLKLEVDYCTATTLSDCPNVPIPADTVDPETNRYLGWFWDMPTSGERLTGKMSLINGIVVFNTFYPATETYDCVVAGSTTTCKTRLDPCQYGGDGWQMGLNAVNGYMEDQFPVFDVNLDGVIDSHDALSAGVKIGAVMGGTTFAKGIGNTYVGVGAATNVSHTGLELPPVASFGTAGSGRVSWFELLD